MIDLGEKRRKTGRNIRDLTLESCFKKGIPNSDDKYSDECLVVELRSFLSTMSFGYVIIVRTKSNKPNHVFYHIPGLFGIPIGVSNSPDTFSFNKLY